MSNKRLVEPGTVLYRIKPASCPFFTGLAPAYSERYSKDALEPYINRDEFGSMVRALNGTLFEYWPCPLCFYCFGLVLGILTLGLSCLLPYLCIRDAKSRVNDHIVSLNRKLKNKGIMLKLSEKCCWRSSIDVVKITEQGVDYKV